MTPGGKELMALLDPGMNGEDLRSKWGLRFARAGDGGKSAAYRDAREEKAEFRQSWLAPQFERIMRTREKKTEKKKSESAARHVPPLFRLVPEPTWGFGPRGLASSEEYRIVLHSDGG